MERRWIRDTTTEIFRVDELRVSVIQRGRIDVYIAPTGQALLGSLRPIAVLIEGGDDISRAVTIDNLPDSST